MGLTRRTTGGGQWVNVTKVVVFGVLILGGLWALAGLPGGEIRSRMQPFFAAGIVGLFQAMGFTFIALQGVDLIVAVAGEIREPGRTIPRALFLSLGIALFIYSFIPYGVAAAPLFLHYLIVMYAFEPKGDV